MTVEEAKRVIREDTPDGNIAARLEAIQIALQVLGRSASMKKIWAWAEKAEDIRDQLEEVYIELNSDMRKLQKLKEKREERYASIFPGAIDYSRDKVQSSASNPMEGWMADIDAMDKEIASMQRIIGYKKDRYTAEFNLWGEPVIWEHYINLTPWKRVGAKLGISRKTVYNQRKWYFEKQKENQK